MNRASRRSTRRASGLAGVSLIATTGLLGSYVGGLRLPHAQAATFQVTTTNDTGAGSLRQAIIDANNSAGADTITITATGTLTLQSALPAIEDDLAITGPGADQFAIDANGGSRPFTVQTQGLDLQVSDLTVRNSSEGGIYILANDTSLTVTDAVFDNNQFSFGGAITTFGTDSVTVRGSTFNGNRSTALGGAVFVNGDALLIEDSQFTANSGGTWGGAVYSQFVPDVRIDRSVFTGNTSARDGGAFYANNGTGGGVTVSDSQFRGNTADRGGAVGADFRGILTIDGSTFDGNVASTGAGGAIWAFRPLTITNSTLTVNTSGGRGGAVFNGTGTVNASFVTVTGNVSADGGAVFANQAITIDDSIVQGNTVTTANYPGSPGADVAGAGTVTAARSLFTDQTKDSVSANGADPLAWDPADGNRFSADPVVGDLADNGGFTLPDGTQILTMQPLADSPVLDAVPAAPGQPEFDQRGTGFPRVSGGSADMGAVEVAVPDPSPSPTQTTTPSPSPTPTPTPTPSPSPTTKPTTDLAVKARAAGNRVRADRRTTLIYRIRTDGDVTKVRTQCTLQGQPLSKRLQQRLCDFQIITPDRADATATAVTPLRVRVDPTCSTSLRFRVSLGAKADGERPITWSRTWRGTPGDPCRIPGTG